MCSVFQSADSNLYYCTQSLLIQSVITALLPTGHMVQYTPPSLSERRGICYHEVYGDCYHPIQSCNGYMKCNPIMQRSSIRRQESCCRLQVFVNFIKATFTYTNKPPRELRNLVRKQLCRPVLLDADAPAALPLMAVWPCHSRDSSGPSRPFDCHPSPTLLPLGGWSVGG